MGILVGGLAFPARAATPPLGSDYLSPADVIASADGQKLYVACSTGARVLEVDVASGNIKRTVPVKGAPSGLALSRDGEQLLVTCAAPQSSVAMIDLAQGKVARTIRAGHTAVAPVLSRDGATLYVCNRFNNEVAFLDLASSQVRARLAVPREPVAAALTPDGRLLLVANHIHAGRADLDNVASSVSVIDTASARVVKEITLVNGSGLLRGIAISPDGKFAAVTHLVSRFHLPTTQIERGWINNAGLTLIDLATLRAINTVLLDNIDSGAANPWAVQWSADGQRIVVTHAGTHELSVIDAPGLVAKLGRMPKSIDPGPAVDYTVASRVAADVPNDLSFLVGLRSRVKLPPGDLGPRGLVLIGKRAYAANYFSDSLSAIEITDDRPATATFPLGPKVPRTAVRQGEFYFNDASICFQGWQSCSSCHSSEARVDGLNWDNLNDGIGNPKNAKSLLLAHFTPPSMWLGVRESANVAVRAGIKNSLFTVQPPEVATALDAYLSSLRPLASPHLVNGKPCQAAERGRQIFNDETVGCSECHKGKYLTDQKQHDVGTRSQYDKADDKFDTPTLLEVWRSAPYLHDGSAVTIRDVLTTRNRKGEHGNVSGLSPQQIDDLVAFVLSL